MSTENSLSPDSKAQHGKYCIILIVHTYFTNVAAGRIIPAGVLLEYKT